MPYQPHLLYSPSPTSSDFKSPAFSFASTDTHEGMSEDGFSLERDAGDTYDRQAAALQRRMVQERNQIVPAKLKKIEDYRGSGTTTYEQLELI